MDAHSLVLLLPVVLPLIGKLLLQISVVPNKVIPLINTAVATVAMYWSQLGFGTLGQVPVPVPGADTGMLDGQTVMMAGALGELGRFGLSLAWGVMNQAGAHFFYEGQRAMARATGGPKALSWWETGKKDIWKKD